MEDKRVLLDYMRQFSDLSDGQLLELIKDIPIRSYKKGDIIIEQGGKADGCFFILQGIARKFSVDKEGVETTYGFYMEQDSIVIFYGNTAGLISPYSVVCMEDCTLIYGSVESEQKAYKESPELEMMTRLMIQEDFDEIQDQVAGFIRMTPKERVEHLMETRPTLFGRVPQHQIASYLGLTPESLSRIKRRIEASHLKVVE